MNVDMAIRKPVVRGSLALYPVFSDAPAAPAYLTGPGAEAAGVLAFTELGEGPSVPELLVANHADQPVLLVEGEQVLGAKQNRTLNASVLCAAKSQTTLPVSCVEAGRWDTPRSAARSRRNAPGDLRRLKTESVMASRRAGSGPRSDQAAVWERVDTYAAALRAVSGTSALEDVYGAVDDDLNALVVNLQPLPEQRGVLVAIGGQVRSLDLFDKASTLAAYWDGLVAGYAIDALHEKATEPARADAEAFVARLAGSSDTQQTGVGLGTDHLLDGDGLVGAGLEWEGGFVHVAAFSTARDGHVARQRPIRRPFRRR